MPSNHISVIIPTFNSWTTLKETIASIKKQTIKPLETIVVDNASTDGTSELVKKHFPEVKLITNQKNLGVTGGRNSGIKALSPKAEMILFFDHDMIADKDMMENLLETFALEDKIGIVTPKIFFFEPKNTIWAAGTSINMWTGQVFFRGGKDIGQYDQSEEVQIAPAAFMLTKEALSVLKKFDDRYFATYEDSDFCLRAKKAGFKTFYSSKAIAYHKISRDPKEEAARLLGRAYFVGRNRVLFMKDFGNNFLIFLLFLPVFVLYYFKLALVNNRLKDWLNFMRGTWDGLAGR
jgi:GT2 family glycosyltransferase